MLAILTVVAGCAGGRPPQPVKPALVPARSVLSSDAAALRDKWYRNRAEQQLIEQCMTRLGFVYTVPDMGPAPGPNTITSFALGSRGPATYGVTPEEFTDAPPTDPGSDQPRYALALDGPASDSGTMTFGGAGKVSYQTGGCQGNARKQLYGSVELYMESAYLPQIEGSAFTGYLADDRSYGSALRGWQACMKARDLPAASPDAAANSVEQLAGNSSAAALTRRQTALAAADAACDGKSHLRQRTNEALDRFVGSLSSQLLTQLDAVAGSRAKADRMARQIVSS
ncbi:MAG TPA: hypothetical protein VHF06_10740 [Pseudonocardiaceae bacterium]|nr:hypothetical protein [Pseudonocardiaceae bacterium]